MRYVKLLAVALLVSWLVFELVINLSALTTPLTLQINLPFYPLGRLTMPVWFALLAGFTLAFILAVSLEIAAWYEYTRLIRLQRRQILALQRALGNHSTASQTLSSTADKLLSSESTASLKR